MRGWQRLSLSKIKSLRSSKFYLVVAPLLVARYVTLSASSATMPPGPSIYRSTHQTSNTHANTILFSVDQYLNTTKNSSDQNIYYDLNKKLSVANSQILNLDINLNWSQNENYLYTHISNLYYSIQGIGSNIDIGFKKMNWSENMDYFNSQEWQQQLERNKLHPKTGGNLGLYYNFYATNLKVDLSYSPFFLPTRGPDLKFENGAAVTQSPWFIEPPKEVPYDGETFSTQYQLQDPDLSEFLKQQSYAFRVLALDGKKWVLNLGYANKPSPKLVNDLDFIANVSDPDVPIDVFIKPRVVRHQLISTEITYKFSQLTQITFGYLNEKFDRQSSSSESETYMQPLDQDVFTALISRKTQKTYLSLGGIFRDGGRSKSVGELSTALENQNINYIYEQAIKFDFTYFKTWGWTINTSVSYDFLQKGILSSASLQRSVANAILNIGFDALEPIRASDEASFIYQYRNLDRVWAGVSYVF